MFRDNKIDKVKLIEIRQSETKILLLIEKLNFDTF